MKKKNTIRVAATVAAAGVLTACGAIAPANAIGGGYMPKPPKSAGLCAFVLLWMPFDTISIRKYC